MEGKPTPLRGQQWGRFHLAGIIPVAGHKHDFGFQWDNVLMPIAEGYTAIEHSIMECAYAGCDTIWIVCNTDIQPLIRHRIGSFVQDPIWHGRVLSPYPAEERRPIPIHYVPIHPKDREKVDCYAWSVLHGANTAYWINLQMSRWVTPDKYFVSFPLSVSPENAFRPHRQLISSSDNFFLSYDGKTVKDGEYLSFTFGPSDFINCRRIIRTGTGTTVPGMNYTSEDILSGNFDILPFEERWSAKHFSLDKVFEPVIIEGENVKEVEWFHNISTWEGYSDYFASEESKTVTRPYKGIMNYREWNGIGVEYGEEEDE